MLQCIHVKNMALIDEAQFSLGPNLNIMTGETGAGKSIIIGSVAAALGGKASKTLIRKGESYASVELTFEVASDETLKALAAMDLPIDGSEVIISRRITENRSVSRINGEVVSLQTLRNAAALLIDIHGQHEHQSLLHIEQHLAIVDRFAGEEAATLKGRIRICFEEYRKLKRALDEAQELEGRKAGEMDFLRFQIQEIEDANLVPGEDEELERSFRKMSNARQMMENVAAAHEMTGYEGSSAGDMIGRALRELYAIQKYDNELDPLIDQLSEIDSLLNDFNRELADYKEGLVFDEAVYRETEARLDLIERLKTKYGNTIEKILAYRDECGDQLAKLEDYDHYLAKLKQDHNDTEQQLKGLSDQLTRVRQTSAKTLSSEITGALKDLNFGDVRFAIDRKEAPQYTADGKDIMQFLVALNPGEDLMPLGSVASGGELSRIMLAIKSVLADADAIETLIFDEIDTGISGRTAQKVSERMALIAANHQVICITHLPQIASMADHHYVIEKENINNRSVTMIRPLSDEERTEEVARLLGGAVITDAVRQNAGEMILLANDIKQRS